jgi:hypothetical protein
MSRQSLALLVVAVTIYLLISWLTMTVNPVEQGANIANALEGLANMKLTHATLDDSGSVVETPDDLAAAASEVLGSPVDVEEYALARMVACEALSDVRGGTDEDKVARIWVALNDAEKNHNGDIVTCLTGGLGFGPQGSRAYATGRNDPTDYHLSLVRACRSGATPDPTQGATHFMDKYGFATNHIYDPAKYAAAVAKWKSHGWAKILDLPHGLEIWT